jgi:hypothetical protein
MEGSLVVSIVAVLIAVSSLALALRADRRAGRAEARSLRAHLVVEPRGSGSTPSGRRFDLRVRNVGSGVARSVRVWLEDESGRVVSGPTDREPLTLAPSDDPVDVSLTVSEAALPPPPVSFSVWIAWSDGAGAHERVPAGATVST